VSVRRPVGARDESRVHRLGETGGNRCATLNGVIDAAPTEKVRVVVGEDHPLFRDGLVRALTSSGAVDVVAEADDGLAAFALIKTHLPHVALLDYRMPGMDGAKVAAAVRRDDLPTRVLLLSAHDESAIVFHALAEGAAGFLPKESTKTEIVKAVLDCAKGRDVVSPAMAAGLAGEIRRRAEAETTALSPREREVLNFIAQGYSIPTIAAELYLAPSTVKTHVQRLYEKLGVGDRAAAVAAAMRRGLLE
jgi:two-component system, NarL family, nitrate/nitrite response regulator NarL